MRIPSSLANISILLGLSALQLGAMPLAYNVIYSTGGMTNPGAGTGHFVYEPDTNQILSWEMSLGSLRGPSACTDPFSCDVVSASVNSTATIFQFHSFFFVGTAGISPGLILQIPQPITGLNPGGTLLLVPGATDGSGSQFINGGGFYVPITSGSLTSVPEGGCAWYVAAGLAGLLYIRRNHLFAATTEPN